MINPLAREILSQCLLFLDDQSDDLHMLIKGADDDFNDSLDVESALRELLDKRDTINTRLSQFIAQLQEVMPGVSEVAITTEYQTT